MAEPISLEDAKEHCRVIDDDSEDALIERLIVAARESIEDRTGHVLVERQITEQRDCFDKFIQLYRRPIISVDEIGYLDTDGAQQTYSGFVTQAERWPVRVYPAFNEEWPALGSNGDVRITYTAGYEAGEEPQALVQAMLLLIGHWYKNRETVSIGNIAQEVPLAVTSLCDQFRAPGL